MNPDHPAVRLCSRGIELELGGRMVEAAALYEQAWRERTDALGGCVAAHYLARVQDSPGEGLRWNREAVRQAEAIEGGGAEGLWPSLWLNLGFSHELMGDPAAAIECYQKGEATLNELPDDDYGRMIRDSVTAKLERLRSEAQASQGG